MRAGYRSSSALMGAATTAIEMINERERLDRYIRMVEPGVSPPMARSREAAARALQRFLEADGPGALWPYRRPSWTSRLNSMWEVHS